MRKLIIFSLDLIALACLVIWASVMVAYGQGQGNIAGILYASNFAGWSVGAGNNGNYNWTNKQLCVVTAGGITFNAFTPGVPVYLADTSNPSTSETVTPSAVTINNSGCSLRINPTNQHSSFYFRTATAGLGEAIGYAGNQPFVINLTPQWQQIGGITSMITSSIGNANVSIIDQRTSVAQPYTWNGTQYVANGSAACAGGCVTSLNGITNAATLVAGNNITVQPNTPTAGNITISSTGGTATLPASVPVLGSNSAGAGVAASSQAIQNAIGSGVYQTPISNVCAAGSGITCPLSGSTYNFSVTGSAGSGNVASALQYQLGGYNAAGTTIGGLPNLYSLNPSMSTANINSLLGGLSSGSVLIPQGVAQQNFTPNFNVSMLDTRLGATYFPIMGNGLACDATSLTVSLTSGSTTATSAGGFSTASVGKTIVAAGPFGGTQYVFTPTITGYTSATQVTISTPAPFTQTAQIDPVGTMNTGALQAIMNQMGQSFPGLLPSGCTALTDTLAWNNAQRLVGQSSSSNASHLIFVDGHDGIQQPDTAGLGGAGAGGAGLEHMALTVGGRVDAAMAPITYVNSAGTVTVQPALYRPDHYHQADNNNPLAPGWCQGNCQNGVASTTASSATICVPTAEYSRLTAASGNAIMFRDFASIYSGTVTALSGSGCASGFSGATVSPVIPATSAQTEWFQSTAGFQTITTAIAAGTVTYPFTVTFGSSIAPTPAAISNFATHGRFKTKNGEEYQYVGVNYAAGTAVVRAGPATSAGQTGPFIVAPENPCPAKYEQPWPVIPSINTGNSTPAGANWFPSRCIGAAAISFPQANGNVYSQGGLVKGILNDLLIGVNDTYHPNTLDQNSTAAVYMAGNTAPYHSDLGFINMVGTQYGIEISPASSGMHGVAANAVDSVNNHFHDLTVYSAYPINITSSNQFHLNDVDAYSTAFDPYDGTDMGAGESLFLGYSLDEQTGSVVTNTAVCNVSNWNAEPESGNGQEVPPYFESDCATAHFDGNNFEGVPAVIGGQKQIVSGGQLSATAAAPILNYGSQNVISDTQQTSTGPITTTYGLCTYCDWGSYNRAGVFGNNGGGPIISPGVGNRNSYNGDDSMYAVTGNYASPYGNILSGFISNDEMASTGLVKTIDSTAPKGSYTSCSITGSTSCQASNFNGFNGGILIGPYDRLQPIAQNLSFWIRTASGTVSTLLYVQALNNAANTCTSPGTIINPTISLTSTWSPKTYAVNLANYSGCDIGFSIGPSTSGSAQVEISSPNFIPVPSAVHAPIASYTAGAVCPSQFVPGDILGSDGASNLYLCGTGSVIVTDAFAGGGSGGGISALTGDVTASGSGSVAATVTRLNGVALSGINGLLQDTSGTISQATTYNLTGAGTLGTYSRSGSYTVPCTTTPIFDLSQGDNQVLTLSTACGTVTGSSITNLPAFGFKQNVSIQICQDSAGSHPFPNPTWAAGWTPITQLPSTDPSGGCTTQDFIATSAGLQAPGYNSAMCVSSANPAVCGNAYQGYFTIAAGTNPTTVVNTTSVGTLSKFYFQKDETLGSSLGVTCAGSTSDPSAPLKITSRTSGSAFTVEAPGTLTGIWCGSFTVTNP